MSLFWRWGNKWAKWLISVIQLVSGGTGVQTPAILMPVLTNSSAGWKCFVSPSQEGPWWPAASAWRRKYCHRSFIVFLYISTCGWRTKELSLPSGQWQMSVIKSLETRGKNNGNEATFSPTTAFPYLEHLRSRLKPKWAWTNRSHGDCSPPYGVYTYNFLQLGAQQPSWVEQAQLLFSAHLGLSFQKSDSGVDVGCTGWRPQGEGWGQAHQQDEKPSWFRLSHLESLQSSSPAQTNH